MFNYICNHCGGLFSGSHLEEYKKFSVCENCENEPGEDFREGAKSTIIYEETFQTEIREKHHGLYQNKKVEMSLPVIDNEDLTGWNEYYKSMELWFYVNLILMRW